MKRQHPAVGVSRENAKRLSSIVFLDQRDQFLLDEVEETVSATCRGQIDALS
jgi:hypothetical protein